MANERTTLKTLTDAQIMLIGDAAGRAGDKALLTHALDAMLGDSESREVIVREINKVNDFED